MTIDRQRLLERDKARVRRVTRGSRSGHESLVRACLDYLRLHRVPCFRVNQRPVLTTKGWRSPGADAGAPDLVAALPPAGRACLIECKTGAAQTRREQLDLLLSFAAVGAVFVVVRSTRDLDPLILSTLKRGRPRSTAPGAG